MAKKRKVQPILTVSKGKRKVRKNGLVTMPLKALRRLLGAARRGKKARVKARVH